MYRTWETSGWTDPKVKALDPLVKLIFVYLVTNHHSHVSGVYCLADVTICHELSITTDVVARAWDTLSAAGLLKRDADRDVIWIVNMLRYQSGGGKLSPKLASSALKHLDTLHNSPALPRVFNALRSRVEGCAG
jgi:hypothetical protein